MNCLVRSDDLGVAINNGRLFVLDSKGGPDLVVPPIASG